MSRYIDADRLLNGLKSDALYPLVEKYGIERVIDAQPTADVRENIKGEWLSGDCMGASCSKCGEYFSFRTFSEVHNFNFCPNCGAEMRGEQDG